MEFPVLQVCPLPFVLFLGTSEKSSGEFFPHPHQIFAYIAKNPPSFLFTKLNSPSTLISCGRCFICLHVTWLDSPQQIHPHPSYTREPRSGHSIPGVVSLVLSKQKGYLVKYPLETLLESQMKLQREFPVLKPSKIIRISYRKFKETYQDTLAWKTWYDTEVAFSSLFAPEICRVLKQQLK